MGVREAGVRPAGALGPIIRDVVSRCLWIGFGAFEESAGMEGGGDVGLVKMQKI